MKDNIVQIKTTERVVNHGDGKSYFYGRIMLGFNEILQDFGNSKKNRKFIAIIRNVVFDEFEVDNIILDEEGNDIVDGKVTSRKIIKFSDKGYNVTYDNADLLYGELKRVVESCADHNEIKLWSLNHDTLTSETHYPAKEYVTDDFDYSKLFKY